MKLPIEDKSFEELNDKRDDLINHMDFLKKLDEKKL